MRSRPSSSTRSPTATPPFLQRSPIDLDGADERFVRSVRRAGVLGAGVHVEDRDDPAGVVPERDRERDQRVLHPERAHHGFLPHERHPVVGGQALASHQPGLALVGRVRDLDVERDGAVVGPDRQRGRRVRVRGVRRSARDGDEQQQGDEPHEPIVPRVGARRGGMVSRYHGPRRTNRQGKQAGVAQSAEHLHGKEGVRGSSPLSGSDRRGIARRNRRSDGEGGGGR